MQITKMDRFVVEQDGWSYCFNPKDRTWYRADLNLRSCHPVSDDIAPSLPNVYRLLFLDGL